jgi:hypothetical protein
MPLTSRLLGWASSSAVIFSTVVIGSIYVSLPGCIIGFKITQLNGSLPSEYIISTNSNGRQTPPHYTRGVDSDYRKLCVDLYSNLSIAASLLDPKELVTTIDGFQ